MTDQTIIIAAILGFPVLALIALGIAYTIVTLTDHYGQKRIDKRLEKLRPKWEAENAKHARFMQELRAADAALRKDINALKNCPKFAKLKAEINAEYIAAFGKL